MERAYVFKSKSAVVSSTQLLQGHSGGRTGDFPRGERATEQVCPLEPRVKWYSGGGSRGGSYRSRDRCYGDRKIRSGRNASVEERGINLSTTERECHHTSCVRVIRESDENRRSNMSSPSASL